MLPRAHRLTRPADFADAVRRGRRVGSPRLVLHYCAGEEEVPARIGFIVSKAVGGAVIRNRVKRRLRHVMADNLQRLPEGSRLVVRALPVAATAPTSLLHHDVDTGLARLQRSTV